MLYITIRVEQSQQKSDYVRVKIFEKLSALAVVLITWSRSTNAVQG